METIFNHGLLVKELNKLRYNLNRYLGHSIVYLSKDSVERNSGVSLVFEGFPDKVHFSVCQPMVTYSNGNSWARCTPEEFEFDEELGFLGAELFNGDNTVLFGIDLYRIKQILDNKEANNG